MHLRGQVIFQVEDVQFKTGEIFTQGSCYVSCIYICGCCINIVWFLRMIKKIFVWWCSLSDKQRFKIIEEAYYDDKEKRYY